MSLVEKTTHVADGLAELITQFRGKPNMEAVLTAYLEQVQCLEAVFFDLLGILTNFDGQTDAQLDLWGAIVGVARAGYSDAHNLRRIKAQIIVNYSSGLPEEIALAIQVLVDNDYVITEPYTAEVYVTIDGQISSTDAEPLAEVLADVLAGGVRGSLIWADSAEDEQFKWATGNAFEADADAGFGDTTSSGGNLANIEEL